MDKKILSSIEEIIEEAKQGKMFILVDDEDRENEGDLVIPAEKADASAINFMAKYARGLICLTLEKNRARELGLQLMTQSNYSRFQTAFTVSIEAKEGVTTGISAADRAKTISVAIDPSKDNNDICTPGHVFPIIAREGGVLVRAGHTEAAVDIARMAGLNPSGVICEIMNEDGTMSRMPDLIEFANKHNLKIATIADLIAYRRKNNSCIRKEVSTIINSKYGGEFSMHIYVNTVTYAEHIALVKGHIDSKKPVMVRMHSLNLINDLLGDTSENKQDELHKSMEIIANHGNGIIVVLREPHKTSLSDHIKIRHGEEKAEHQILRDYGIGAQILLDLGVKEMIILSNSHKSVVGLEGYGLTILKQEKI